MIEGKFLFDLFFINYLLFYRSIAFRHQRFFKQAPEPFKVAQKRVFETAEELFGASKKIR